jgi:hypothetical protein
MTFNNIIYVSLFCTVIHFTDLFYSKTQPIEIHILVIGCSDYTSDDAPTASCLIGASDDAPTATGIVW